MTSNGEVYIPLLANVANSKSTCLLNRLLTVIVIAELSKLRCSVAQKESLMLHDLVRMSEINSNSLIFGLVLMVLAYSTTYLVARYRLANPLGMIALWGVIGSFGGMIGRLAHLF